MSRKVERERAALPERLRQPRGKSALDCGFDRWVSKRLHQMYDPVLAEAIPEDMLRLLEGFDEPRKSAGDADPDGRTPPPEEPRD